jgi:predicted ferric reductase
LGAGGIGEAHDASDALTTAGRLAALLGAYLSLLAVLLLARMPWLERRFGFGRLTLWHRHVARGCIVLLFGHAAFTTAGLTVGDRISLPAELARLVSQYPGVITAIAALLLLVAVAASSVARARRRLRYERWYALHLYTYLAIALAFSHQVATGKDFVGNPWARTYWIALYLVTLGALVLFRVVRPIALAARHRLRVERVVEEGPGVVSILITGRHLRQLRAQAGQFFLWRFLTAGRWAEAHPFSLSAAPGDRTLRITVASSGDFSAGLRDLRPGTWILAEGPLGVFTEQLQRRPHVALIAGGIGITPIRALLETMSGDIELLYCPRDPSQILFRDELEELAAASGARIHFLADHGLSCDVLLRVVPDIAGREAFVCGSPSMVRAARTSLRQAGVSSRSIFVERFAL